MQGEKGSFERWLLCQPIKYNYSMHVSLVRNMFSRFKLKKENTLLLCNNNRQGIIFKQRHRRFSYLVEYQTITLLPKIRSVHIIPIVRQSLPPQPLPFPNLGRAQSKRKGIAQFVSLQEKAYPPYMSSGGVTEFWRQNVREKGTPWL